MKECTCCECGKSSPNESNTWRPGEVCLFGNLFACTMACAKAYAAKHAKEGWRPGEPNFDAEEVAGPVKDEP